MTLKPEDEHWHSGLWGDGKRIKARDLDWTGYALSGSQWLAYDMWYSSWYTPTNGAFKQMAFLGAIGDSEKMITGIHLKDYWLETWVNFTAKITMQGNITMTNGTFTVKPWQVCRMSVAFNTQGIVGFDTTWGSNRYITGDYNNSAHPSTNLIRAFVNSGTTDMIVKPKWATTTSSNPIFWLFIEIF